MEFPCTKCSACCRALNIPLIYSFPLNYHNNKIVDRGDGVCINLDTKTNLCKIYENRPRLCRIIGLKPKDVKKKDWFNVNVKVCQLTANRVFGDSIRFNGFTKDELIILDKMLCKVEKLILP